MALIDLFYLFFQELLGFIFAVGDAIKGLKIRDIEKQNLEDGSPCRRLLGIFGHLINLVDLTPPQEQEQRFGNKAYRDWHAKLQKVSQAGMESITFHP